MKPLSEQSHYEILEVEATATGEAIEEAWRKMRRLLGPGSIATYSLVDPKEQQALLLRLDEAREVLTDPGMRRAYDRGLGLEVPEPVEADVVGAVPLEAEADDDEVLELELDDEDVLEVFEATPGPLFGPTGERTAWGAPGEVAAAEADVGDEDGVREEAAGDHPDVDEEAAEAARDDGDAPGDSALVPFGDNALGPSTEETAPVPPLVDGGTRFSGELLRRLREAAGLSLEEFSARTRIGVHHLNRVEEEAWSSLPERVFLRGILGNYARELRLDPNQVCETYLARKPR